MLHNNEPKADPRGTPWINSHRHYLFILFLFYFTLTFNNFYKIQKQLTSYVKPMDYKNSKQQFCNVLI